MSPAARSLQVFGAYLMLLALVLLLSPDTLLELFGIPPTDEVWIRVVGMLVGFLGFYYLQAGRADLRAFVAWTVPVRLSVPVFLASFVALGTAPLALLQFDAVDATSALWTWSALRGS